MNWFILFLAGLLEIAWAIGLKYSEGFTKLWPSFWTVITMVASMVLLAIAMKSLPVGTAYAVWTGIGATGSIILGMVIYSEPPDPVRVLCLTLIVAGMVGDLATGDPRDAGTVLGAMIIEGGGERRNEGC